MIFEFAQKSFPTQYLLPFYRFAREEYPETGRATLRVEQI